MTEITASLKTLHCVPNRTSVQLTPKPLKLVWYLCTHLYRTTFHLMHSMARENTDRREFSPDAVRRVQHTDSWRVSSVPLIFTEQLFRDTVYPSFWQCGVMVRLRSLLQLALLPVLVEVTSALLSMSAGQHRLQSAASWLQSPQSCWMAACSL